MPRSTEHTLGTLNRPTLQKEEHELSDIDGRLSLLVTRPATRRKRSLHSRLDLREFGDELPLSFKPVTHILTMVTATRDIDLKSTVGDLGMGRPLFR